MKKSVLQATISIVALALLAGHLRGFTLDAIALALLALAILPWASDLIKRLELPSGLKVEFQELRGEVEHQKREIDRLTEFLFSHFERASYFDAELRRLRALGLLTGTIGNLPKEGEDLNNHLRITDRGREYVIRREAIPKAANG